MRAQRPCLAFGFLTLAIISAASIELGARLQSDSAAVTHTVEVMNKLLNVRLPIRIAESAQRGFLLTGADNFLDEYRRAIGLIMPAFGELTAATADNPKQQELLVELAPQLARRLDMLEEPLSRRAAGDRASASAFVADGQGHLLMGPLDAGFDRLSLEEQRFLALRSATSRQAGVLLLTVDLFGAAVILLIAWISVMIIRSSNRDRDAALYFSASANVALEAAASERVERLRLANEEIQRTAVVFNNSSIVINNAFTSMSDAMLVVDEHRTILLSNPAAARLFGYKTGMTIEQLVEKNVAFEADGMASLSLDQRPVMRALRGEQFDRLEYVIRRADLAEDIRVLISGRPLVDSSGAIKCAVMVYHDVTEARAIESQLRHVQKMDAIGQLTGGIAHDFNNMLTVITGTIHILAVAVAHDSKLVAITKLIDQAAQRGAEMTAHLLAFAHKQPLRPRPTNVNALIVETANVLPAIGAGIEIESMLDDEAWPALVDAGQLGTALLNLSLNARDAMLDGGKLTLESRNVFLDEAYARSNIGVTPGPYLMIAISDTGTGIPAEIRDRVFEPFFTTKGVGKGTGLGLSMVYGFVKQSNGHIKIYSETGQGTTIKMYLPRATEFFGDVVDLVSHVPAECGSETVLVVEDDAMVLNFVISVLEKLGYTTIAAKNAAEALAIVERRTEFDLLFTDLIMPGMNGGVLAAQILERRPEVKVLFTSGYTDNVLTHKGRLDPGVLLLTKPYREADLAQMIRAALDPLPAVIADKTERMPKTGSAFDAFPREWPFENRSGPICETPGT
jgi:PAS domain S-box-containing protein